MVLIRNLDREENVVGNTVGYIASTAGSAVATGATVGAAVGTTVAIVEGAGVVTTVGAAVTGGATGATVVVAALGPIGWLALGLGAAAAEIDDNYNHSFLSGEIDLFLSF